MLFSTPSIVRVRLHRMTLQRGTADAVHIAATASRRQSCMPRLLPELAHSYSCGSFTCIFQANLSRVSCVGCGYCQWCFADAKMRGLCLALHATHTTSRRQPCMLRLLPELAHGYSCGSFTCIFGEPLSFFVCVCWLWLLPVGFCGRRNERSVYSFAWYTYDQPQIALHATFAARACSWLLLWFVHLHFW